jgi:feruloyl-CoA synthase
MNAEARGGGGRIARALILTGAPDAASGELTDKGYINQALARSRRPEELARLFAAEPDDGVMVFK